jgi:hypothetical protein
VRADLERGAQQHGYLMHRVPLEPSRIVDSIVEVALPRIGVALPTADWGRPPASRYRAKPCSSQQLVVAAGSVAHAEDRESGEQQLDCDSSSAFLTNCPYLEAVSVSTCFQSRKRVWRHLWFSLNEYSTPLMC